MINETFSIQAEGSLPDTKLVTYIQDTYQEVAIQSRPMILICPGGAYAYTSNREAEAFAMQFLAMGCHAAVLRYSCAPATYPTSLLELAYSVAMLREKAEEWHIDKVIVLGCSAGGHLAASLGVFWEEAFLAEKLGKTDNSCFRPDGLILCYPVITSGKFAHRGSMENLLGERVTDEALLSKMSLENQVTSKMPPAFIWHTYTDGSVPVENSLMLVSAMRRAGVNAEFHMYPAGGHGLGLANRLTQNPGGNAIQEECTTWIPLVRTWIENQFVKSDKKENIDSLS